MEQARKIDGRTAFGYVRTSGQSQVNGDGPERQRLKIAEYAEANGIQVVEIFEEKGVSGAKEFIDRPAWMEMISKLNGTNTIIVEGLDRLAREMGLQEYVLADLGRRGITLLSTREDDVQNPDPSRVLFRQLMGSIYQFEKSMIVLKLRGARQRMKKATGRCEGRKPYGEAKKPEDAAGELATLARMKELNGTMSINAIARTLNAEGLKPRDGVRWYPAVVQRILKAAS